jgi:hypothetical protein
MRCNELLTYAHIKNGIELDKQEDVILLLKDNDIKAVFSTQGATQEEILKEANKLLEDKDV